MKASRLPQRVSRPIVPTERPRLLGVGRGEDVTGGSDEEACGSRDGARGRRGRGAGVRWPIGGRRDQGVQVRAGGARGAAGHDRHVGQPRRGDAHDHVDHRRVRVEGPRQRRDVHAGIHPSRQVRVLLRASSKDARDGDREVGRSANLTSAARPVRAEGHMDRLDRRGFLSCMAWTGSALVWTSTAGVLSSRTIRAAEAADPAPGGFSFVQISDTHIGFKGQANSDAAATLQQLIDRVNGLKPAPAFVLHTGDQTHGQKPGAFDTLAEMLKSVKAERVFYVPGEHDVFLDGGKEYLSRYGKGTVGERGWQSFDYKGTHFVGLVNVLKYKGEGVGALGQDQIEWLEKDLAPLAASTPIVVFAHVPLWAVYPQWGWTTEDAERALAGLKRFGSVTVLNGHIHQVVTKVEGSVRFHTAMSTAFPQPAPGSAPSPGPMKIPETEARRMIGVTQATFVQGTEPLAVVDSILG